MRRTSETIHVPTKLKTIRSIIELIRANLNTAHGQDSIRMSRWTYLMETRLNQLHERTEKMVDNMDTTHQVAKLILVLYAHAITVAHALNVRMLDTGHRDTQLVAAQLRDLAGMTNSEMGRIAAKYVLDDILSMERL